MARIPVHRFSLSPSSPTRNPRANPRQPRGKQCSRPRSCRAFRRRSPLFPCRGIEMNVARGILDSATSKAPTTIIVGWNKPPRLANAFLARSSIKSSRRQSNGARVRAVAPFNAAHIIVIVPPLCDHHPGFERAAMALNALAKKSQAKLHLIALENQGAALAPRLQGSRLFLPDANGRA